MSKLISDDKIQALALHVAVGGQIRAWARKNGVGERTAYGWTKLDEFKAARDAHRKVIADRILGSHFRLADKAMGKIAGLLESQTEGVRQRASEFVISSLVSVSAWAELRAEIDQLKAQIGGQK